MKEDGSKTLEKKGNLRGDLLSIHQKKREKDVEGSGARRKLKKNEGGKKQVRSVRKRCTVTSVM